MTMGRRWNPQSLAEIVLSLVQRWNGLSFLAFSDGACKRSFAQASASGGGDNIFCEFFAVIKPPLRLFGFSLKTRHSR